MGPAWGTSWPGHSRGRAVGDAWTWSTGTSPGCATAGPCAPATSPGDIKELYLGLSGVGQRESYRDVKHYRRRKRWLS